MRGARAPSGEGRRGSASCRSSTAFLIHVAATGWLTTGFAPISSTTSAFVTSITGFDTAPEPMPSSSAATDDAWHSRVQWSTLLDPKPVRTSFWNRYASSLLPLAEPKPASARGPRVSRMRASVPPARASASSHVASRNTRERIGGIHREVGRLGHALAADQRLRQAVRVRDVVEAEAALHAQPLVIRRAVAALDADDLVVVHVIGELAADAAVRAHRMRPCGRSARGTLPSPARARRWARLHAFAAGDARRRAHRVVEVEHDLRVAAAERVADDVVDLLLAARAHAARALDAGVEVHRHRRVRHVRRRLRARREARRADAELGSASARAPSRACRPSPARRRRAARRSSSARARRGRCRFAPPCLPSARGSTRAPARARP